MFREASCITLSEGYFCLVGFFNVDLVYSYWILEQGVGNTLDYFTYDKKLINTKYLPYLKHCVVFVLNYPLCNLLRAIKPHPISQMKKVGGQSDFCRSHF